MKQEIKFLKGGKVEATESGCVVISKSGVASVFDAEGELVETIRVKTANHDEWCEFFYNMGEYQRAKVRCWLKTVEPITKAQVRFVTIVEEALKEIDYAYEISTIEPCLLDGSIGFKRGESVLTNFSAPFWESECREFAPEYGSSMANKNELFLWYAYRIAKGYWTLEYVCDDSSTSGNYIDSPNVIHGFEKTGAREVGGFYDGVGNTMKIVKDGLGYSLCGGYYNNSGKKYPVIDTCDLSERISGGNTCCHVVLRSEKA